MKEKRLNQSVILILATQLLLSYASFAQLPKDYKGIPFKDTDYTKGAQLIPGRVELAYYDLGGEGVAYHDSDPINHGSGELNRKPDHERPGVPEYLVHFREKEGVDISFTKDFADFNHPNKVDPKVNQLYVGWQDDGEWTNYTVDVKAAGKYKIVTVFANASEANVTTLLLNDQKITNLALPVTGDYHRWNQGTVGEITFSTTGLQLITITYSKGGNLGYLDFIPVYEKK